MEVRRRNKGKTNDYNLDDDQVGSSSSRQATQEISCSSCRDNHDASAPLPDDCKSREKEKYSLEQQQQQPQVETAKMNKKLTSIKINFEIDLLAALLLLLGLATRLYRLEEPKNIVFDELHYGKYVSLYMKKTFFFDSHPPLGKQLVSAAAHLAGFDGNFKFDRIGSPYTDNVPLFVLRLIPALCGSLNIPTAYHLALELGLRQWSCAIAALLLLFDNALLTQSRFILMESILIQFSLMGLLCILKFRKVMDKPMTLAWWFWLAVGIVNLTCALCVKYVGFYTLLLALYVIGRDYWSLLSSSSSSSRKTLSTLTLYLHLFARLLVIGLAISFVYLGVFYIHLSVLTKAGPHDSVMTSAFQASLEGGLASITKGQPLEVTHGSQITLRHTHGRACWLHSHDHVYPLRYSDGRGSSHQQQVTCYSFKDVNNWWIVKRPDVNDLVVSSRPIEPIRHGDVIQLVHGITSRALNSHDVAAPMTPQSQEVSCYIDYNVSMPAQNLWKLEIANRDQVGDVWHAIQSQVRLVHVNSEYALKFSGRQLPDWGFNQHEVVADRHIDQSDSIWNVEEHRYTKNEDQKQRERELLSAEMIPLSATSLSFWEKFLELQMKMLLGGGGGGGQEAQQNSHMYSSSPLEWPTMTRGIAYWVSTKSNAQVHLLGNIVVWYSATLAVLAYSSLLAFYTMRRRRLCFDIDEREWNRFVTIGEFLFAGYLVHFLPFFVVERTLFLHHYLPAFVFKVLLTAAVLDHVHYILSSRINLKIIPALFRLALIVWIVIVAVVFRKFTALSYGLTPLTAKEVLKLRWTEEWDFIIHKT